MSVTAETLNPTTERKSTLVIDCDIHEDVLSIDLIRPYLAKEFHDYLKRPLPPGQPTLHVAAKSARADAVRADGSVESAYLEGVQLHHLDPYEITYGILTGLWNLIIGAMPQQYVASALATAYNSWLIDYWLDPEPRLRGSITVAPQLPHEAAREIDRVGSHHAMVQVCLPASSPVLPYGSEFFDPIWEACVRNDLRVGFHVASGGGLYGQPTSTGWSTSYMEQRACYPDKGQGQVISMVANGVFCKFPDLRVAFVECGFGWVPATMWRLDQCWRAMRLETPWLKRRPSDYIRDHIKFSSQPFEEPDAPEHILQLIDMMGSDSMLMFASDYPHWDFDSPTRALPSALGDELRRKILWENASAFYGLPDPATAA